MFWIGFLNMFLDDVNGDLMFFGVCCVLESFLMSLGWGFMIFPGSLMGF